MDWLDTYLDGLAQYKTTVSPCDTHIWGEKPNLNNQQKRMLFDAAAQSELEYRLIVQEARQAEMDAGMGGSYDAGSAARERPATPAAPSGLPAASTGNLIITFADVSNGTAAKINNEYWYVFIDSGGEEVVLQWTGTIWTLQRVVNGEYSGPFGSEANNNTSTSATIPTTGWIYTVTGYGSPAITITAV